MKRSSALLAVFFLFLSALGGAAVSGAEPAFAASEPTPAGFVSGRWRVVVHRTAIADSFDDYGLKDESGKRWVVLIADVTNLGAAGPADLAAFGIGTGEGSSGYFAPTATSTVMKKLSLGDAAKVQINENSTVRIAMAFDVPVKRETANANGWYLGLSGQKLPLKDTVSDAVDVNSLPKLEPTMQLEMGTVQSVEGHGTFTFASQNGGTRSVTMSGIMTPPTDECYGAESAQAVMDTTGGQVWLEKDGGESLVWANDAEHGTFVLVNHRLVEVGAAASHAGKSIYQPWLESVSNWQQQKKEGLWQNCRSATGAYINPPTPTAEEVRAQYQQVDVRDLVIRTDDFVGKKLVVSGSVFNIQVQGTNTGMQIWATTVDGSQEAIVVQYSGDSSGIYEGTWVTVYGTGVGRF